MQKTCRLCKENFNIDADDLEFYERIQVPSPALCSSCRQQRRLSFRNERYLYHRKCDSCDKKIISMFTENAKFPVYCNDCWWSDKWDAMKFGRDYDPNKPFFEQFKELYNSVPKFALYNMNSQNSDYCNYAPSNKDCYLIFGSWFNEKCMYGGTYLDNFEVMDSLFVTKCKHSANLVNCNGCYESFYCQLCENCSSSWFLFDCHSCESCLFCTNLRNKKYCIFNKQATKEEYEEEKKKFLGSFSKMAEMYEKYREMAKNEAIHKFLHGEKNQNVTGDYIYNSKNIKNSYFVKDSEDLKHADRTTKPQKDSMDSSGCCGELIYEGACVDFVFNSYFCMDGEHYTDTQYSNSCFEVKNCFGCSGLRHKQYCILNKQYSQEEYEKLVPQIIEKMRQEGEYGEFFPSSLSSFGYNETVANEYYPLNKEEALARGFNWQENLPFTTGKETITFDKVPDLISDVPDSICNEVLGCEKCGQNYKITDQELQFYKKLSLPIPRLCPNCRHQERMGFLNPRKLYKRNCSKCKKDITTTYTPDRSEKVYCEECYLGEVY